MSLSIQNYTLNLQKYPNIFQLYTFEIQIYKLIGS